MPIGHVYILADLPARIIFVPVLYIILTRWTPLFRVQRSVLLPRVIYILLFHESSLLVHAFYPSLLTVLTVKNDFIARKPVLGARCLQRRVE